MFAINFTKLEMIINKFILSLYWIPACAGMTEEPLRIKKIKKD